MACDSVQLCGEYACVWYQNDCEETDNCAEPRQCESAGSIRDRAPRIVAQLRDAQRSCGGSATVNLPGGTNHVLRWDETLAGLSDSHVRDMAKNRFESFIGSDGLSTSERVSRAGVEFTLAFESVTSGPQTAAEAINHWLDINTDCEQLIDSGTTRIGMACAVSERGTGGPYWSLLLVGPEP